MSDVMKPSGSTILDLGSHGQLKGCVFPNGVKRFTHVPYALPPTGPRRWKKPEPLPKDHVYSSDGPLDCTQYGNVCPQPEYVINGKSLIDTDYSFDEDCLAVNVWLPPGDAPEIGWPVLAWIHGGWLQVGDPSLKEHSQPTQLIAEGKLDAIVVSIGYRLNIFGFLAGEGVRGNFGFWDQRCALEWLQGYAHLIGGDPGRVTLGGLSAGAFSTHVQLNYELFHGDDKMPLFQNVWLQSNAIPAQPKSLHEADAQLQDVLSTFSIPTNLSPQDRLDALRLVPAPKLVSKIFSLSIHTFRGVTDDEIIPSDLITNFHSGDFAARFKQRGMRILLGEAETEEVLYSLTNPPPDFSTEQMLLGLNNYYATPVCEKLLSLYTREGAAADPRIASALAQTKEEEKAKLLFGHITSDVQVRAPIRVLAKALFDGGVPAEHVVRYRVAYRPACTDKAYPRSFGVTHGADGISWWYVERYGFSEEEKVNVKKWIGKTLIPLISGSGSGAEELGVEDLLYFKESGEIGVVRDQHWGWLSRVAETLE